jgi:hypothetical protein
VLLLDSGDNGGDGKSVCVTDTNFLWVDVDSYSGQREVFLWMSGPQNGVQGLIDMVEKF